MNWENKPDFTWRFFVFTAGVSVCFKFGIFENRFGKSLVEQYIKEKICNVREVSPEVEDCRPSKLLLYIRSKGSSKENISGGVLLW